jgi:hypothetical protein
LKTEIKLHFKGEFMTSESEQDEVVFVPKALGQKDYCINRSADYDCPNPSTQQAEYVIGTTTASIKCCTNQACMDRARRTAIVSARALSGTGL